MQAVPSGQIHRSLQLILEKKFNADKIKCVELAGGIIVDEKIEIAIRPPRSRVKASRIAASSFGTCTEGVGFPASAAKGRRVEGRKAIECRAREPIDGCGADSCSRANGFDTFH